MDPALGYEYTLAVCSAIEVATDSAAERYRGAFSYRGVDLRHAVERELYVALVNDPELQDAFVRMRRKGSPGKLEPRRWLEAEVARALLSGGNSTAVRAMSGNALRRTLSRARWRARSIPDGVKGSRRGAPSQRPFCFLVDHAKFLGFIDPVVRRLGTGSVALLSLAPEVNEGSGLPTVALYDPATEPVPAFRLAGRALHDHLHLLAQFDRVARVLGKMRPRCLFIIEGNGPLDEIANRAARAAGVPTICLQQGWSPIVHTGFRNMSYGVMAMWGEGFRELFAPYNPVQRFAITGSPAFEAAGTAGRELQTRVGLGGGVGFFLQTATQLISPEHARAMIDLVLETARRLPHTPLLVREHPAHPVEAAEQAALEAVPNVLWAPADRYTLRETLEACRLTVSIHSTSILEGIALGKPAVVFNPTSMPRYVPDVEEHGVGVEAKDAVRALEAIVRVMDDENRYEALLAGMEAFRRHFFAGVDGRAAERIVALADEVAR